MTDHHDPDELASAHLDGATSAEEAERVATDPALLAQVEAMRAVRAAIRQPVDVDVAARDAAITAALDAFEDEGAAAPTAPPGATVTPIAPRRVLSPTARRVLGAAAVVAVLALLVPLLANSTDDDDAGSADAAFEETGAALGGDVETSSGDGGAAPEAAASTTTDLSGARMLGVYDDVDDLLEALAARDEQASDPRSAEADSSRDGQLLSPCGANKPALGIALVDGRQVIVTLVGDADGIRVLLTDAVTCEAVADRRL